MPIVSFVELHSVSFDPLPITRVDHSTYAEPPLTPLVPESDNDYDMRGYFRFLDALCQRLDATGYK